MRLILKKDPASTQHIDGFAVRGGALSTRYLTDFLSWSRYQPRGRIIAITLCASRTLRVQKETSETESTNETNARNSMHFATCWNVKNYTMRLHRSLFVWHTALRAASTRSIEGNVGCAILNFSRHSTSTRMTHRQTLTNQYKDQNKATYYLAQSMSWYSLLLSKLCWTPRSFHKVSTIS